MPGRGRYRCSRRKQRRGIEVPGQHAPRDEVSARVRGVRQVEA